jgi:hypothetical protein
MAAVRLAIEKPGESKGLSIGRLHNEVAAQAHAAQPRDAGAKNDEPAEWRVVRG